MLKNVEVKNRIAMAPMNMCYTGNDNMVSDQQLGHWRSIERMMAGRPME